MDIKTREPFYIVVNNWEYVVRPGTAGVEKNRVVFFHDTTKTAAIGFSRDCCIDNEKIFQISRTLLDAEVSKRDVLKILDGFSKGDFGIKEVYEQINSL